MVPTESVLTTASSTRSVFDPHPTAAPADIFQNLKDDKYFTRIDLSKGYWQIFVREEDIPKTSFVTMGEHYEFVRMPFGMMNSGATLNRVVTTLIRGLPDVSSYVDDVLIHSRTFEEHMETLREVLKRMRDAGLTASALSEQTAWTLLDTLLMMERLVCMMIMSVGLEMPLNLPLRRRLDLLFTW